MKMRDYFKVFNVLNGEVLEDLSIQQVQVERSAEFVMSYQTAHQQFYRDPTLTKGEMRVFGYLESVMDYKNEIDYTQTGIAHDLSMRQGDVSKAINSLIRRGVLSKIKHPGKFPVYRVNPEYTKKGQTLKAIK